MSLLTWLPVMGLGLGMALGVDPLAMLFGTPLGMAALAAGVTETSFQALRPFAAQGLHSALYVVPVFGVVLCVVLFAASRTVARDMEKLQSWMRESTEQQTSRNEL